MVPEEQYLTLSLLITMFPEFRERIELTYRQDPVFREIAREYHECIRKRDSILKETGEVSEFYTETINELKDELINHLTGEIQ